MVRNASVNKNSGYCYGCFFALKRKKVVVYCLAFQLTLLQSSLFCIDEMSNLGGCRGSISNASGDSNNDFRVGAKGLDPTLEKSKVESQ